MAVYEPVCHPQNSIWTSASLRSIYYFVGDIRSINCHMALSAMNYLLIINSQIAYKGDYLSLVCAILYKYIKPLHISNLDNELVPCKIFHLSKQHNYLKERIDQQGLDKKPADMSSQLFCAIFFSSSKLSPI